MSDSRMERILKYKQAEWPQRQSFLFKQPRDIRNLILSRLSFNELTLFASTCQKAEKETLFFHLLQAAVRALPASYEQENMTTLKAIEMLKNYPEWLFKKKHGH